MRTERATPTHSTGRLIGGIAPRGRWLWAFAGGLVLLASGVIAHAATRVAALARVEPIGGLAASHLVGVTAGVAVLGSAILTLVVALTRVLAPQAPAITTPTDTDLDAARAVIDRQPWTLPNLVFLRDKALLFDDEREAFVMYAVQARTWVALGDPVGPDDRAGALIRRFLDRCDEAGGVPAFYEVRQDHLHHYRDLGLTVVKLGEEARVALATFTLAGGCWSKHRQILRHLERSGVTFRVVPREATPPIMDRLRAVSDEWMASRTGAEKGFSLGRFNVDYLSHFDIAVMEREGEIIAFANLWAGAQRGELATDLIRHLRNAPAETMEALLVHVMTWGRMNGYQCFSLGVAPLSGLEGSSAPSLWNRIGSFLYAHGERFYRFRGIRLFKQKFHPQWEPRYLAYRGGIGLPLILADASALIAGGYRKVISK